MFAFLFNHEYLLFSLLLFPALSCINFQCRCPLPSCWLFFRVQCLLHLVIKRLPPLAWIFLVYLSISQRLLPSTVDWRPASHTGSLPVLSCVVEKIRLNTLLVINLLLWITHGRHSCFLFVIDLILLSFFVLICTDHSFYCHALCGHQSKSRPNHLSHTFKSILKSNLNLLIIM